MPHGRAGRTAVAEKSHGFLIIIFPGAAVITALPQVAEGGKPAVNAFFHQIHRIDSGVVAEKGKTAPAGIVQRKPLAGHFIRDIPGMAACKDGGAVAAAPVQFAHEIQRAHRKADGTGRGGGRFRGAAEGRGPDFADAFLPEPFGAEKGLLLSRFSQTVVLIIRFSVTDKNDSHSSFPPVPIHFKICFGLYHERPGFESDPAGKTNPGREMIPDGIGRPFFS